MDSRVKTVFAHLAGNQKTEYVTYAALEELLSKLEDDTTEDDGSPEVDRTEGIGPVY